MSTTSVSPLSAGVQQLYNQGLLPTSLSNSVLNGASASQLSQLANTAIASEQNAALFGYGSDSASLSSTASNALLQEINPSASSTTAGTDPLTQAVNNALTSNLDAAVNKFLPQSASTSSGQINLLG
jgi:hypothetical protein